MASVGSAIFVAVAFTLISLLAILLLRYYLPLRTTPAYLLVPVFLAIALPANLILLVPIDLASNPFSDEPPRGIWLPQRALLVAWRISYWLTFVLTWLILPILGEYVCSTPATANPRRKLMYSLRSNGRYYLAALAVGVLGAVYFIFSQGLSFNALSALVMALAYAWGLILAIYLMGHGLVAIPRNVLRNADIGRRLKRLQCGAPTLYEKLIDASDELKEYEHRIYQLSLRKGRTAKDLQEWIQELAEMVSMPEHGVPQPPVSGRRQNIPEVITAGYLADLTRNFMRSRHKKQRYVTEWQNLLASATRTQLILDAKPSGRLIFPDSTAHWISPALRYRLYAQVSPMVSYASGAFLSVASAAVVWSELTKTLVPHLSPVSRTILPTSAKHVGFFPSQVFAAFWILYMTTCALYSITVIPIWGNRALVRRTTYSESAAWYAAQVARLTVPLAYNFLTFLPKDVLEKTRFYRFLGEQINFHLRSATAASLRLFPGPAPHPRRGGALRAVRPHQGRVWVRGAAGRGGGRGGHVARGQDPHRPGGAQPRGGVRRRARVAAAHQRLGGHRAGASEWPALLRDGAVVAVPERRKAPRAGEAAADALSPRRERRRRRLARGPGVPVRLCAAGAQHVRRGRAAGLAAGAAVDGRRRRRRRRAAKGLGHAFRRAGRR